MAALNVQRIAALNGHALIAAFGINIANIADIVGMFEKR